jgi:hypothetical protein
MPLLLTSRAKLFEQVQAILEKYQEQSNLLDSHLEAMMAVIMGRAREMTTAREAAAIEAQAAGAGFPYQVSHSRTFVVFYELRTGAHSLHCVACSHIR